LSRNVESEVGVVGNGDRIVGNDDGDRDCRRQRRQLTVDSDGDRPSTATVSSRR